MAVAFSASLVAHAQPANDAFANAWTMSGGAAVTNGTTTLASKEGGEPNHAGNQGGRSVWFNWVASRDGQVRIDTVGSAFNTLLAVYTGNAVNALTQVAANNDIGGGNNASRVEFAAIGGATYRIAIDANRGFGGAPPGGNYVLNLQVLASITIISPANGSIAYAGAPLFIEVEAEVGNPPVTRVDFFRAGALIGTDAAFPFDLTVNDPPLGTNVLSAVAVDNGGLAWTSAVVRVAVLNVGVTIVSPLNGAIFQNTNPIGVSVVGSLPSGTITNVEFFADEQKFGQDATAPFAAPWNNTLGGVHRLTAIGRDGAGLSYTSSPVTISIPRALVPLGSVWKYLDNGSDQGTNWTARNFDDSAWASGPAELGYGDGDESTVVGFGDDPDLKSITTYFRRALSINNATNYTNLTVNIKRDDGAVLYLNGVEVQRFNMPFGPVSYQTAGLTASDDGEGVYTVNVPRNLLADGLNVLAVEVHQDSTITSTNDDLSFDLHFQGVLFPANQPPLIAFTSPTNGEIFLAPPALTLTANASDPDGAVDRVQFLTNGALLSTFNVQRSTFKPPLFGTIHRAAGTFSAPLP